MILKVDYEDFIPNFPCVERVDCVIITEDCTELYFKQDYEVSRVKALWVVCSPSISIPPPHPHAITRVLVRRYIHVSKRTMRQGIVNEDDLLESKQDISSLRAAPRPPQLLSHSVEAGEVAPVHELKVLDAQIQALCEEFMSQWQQCSRPSSGTETLAMSKMSANASLSASSPSPPLVPPSASSTFSIDRERIGDVSVTYRADAATGLLLPSPRRA
ncbi:unnamed protein product [Taenia asiatica]|uniref:Uncharacterized protein n=1 Tax=Taenia asiatica TaxID=60517 RepID=A0A0R3WCW0_TAEAS|nr:unnamed protein product [Taenia asiatica]